MSRFLMKVNKNVNKSEVFLEVINMSKLSISLATLVFVFLSLGIMTSCDGVGDRCGNSFCGFEDLEIPAPTLSFKEGQDNCKTEEYLCTGECAPIDIDCCIDSFGDEVGSCPEENKFCCEEYDL